MPASAETLAEHIASGDRRSLAKAITLTESAREGDRDVAMQVLERLLPRTGNALRIAITGPPGVGKSTLLDALGAHVLERGHRPAVLAIDPTSPLVSGSILGDKTRMPRLVSDARAFVRPSPSSGQGGGVHARTRETVLLCEAAGYDVVFVETVGVGQSEVSAADLVDVVVLLVQPSAGDDLQSIKRGIIELADVVVVNKADGELLDAAERAETDYRAAAAIRRGTAPVVLRVSARTGAGVAELWQEVEERRRTLAQSGELGRRHAEQQRAWLSTEVDRLLIQRARAKPELQRALGVLEQQVASGALTPLEAARRAVAVLFPRE